MDDRQVVKAEDRAVEPKRISEDKPLMAGAVAKVEADRAGVLRAMQLDVKLLPAFLDLMLESQGTYMTAYGERVELNADGMALFARAMDLSVEELPEGFAVVDKYIGETSGRQEWVVKATVRVTDNRTGRVQTSVETCSSEDSIHSYKERMVNGTMTAQRSYGERFQMVHAHAATRAAKDAIDKMVGFPTLTRAQCDKLGLAYQAVEYGKGKYGGGKKAEADTEQPKTSKPAPEPGF